MGNKLSVEGSSEVTYSVIIRTDNAIKVPSHIRSLGYTPGKRVQVKLRLSDNEEK